MASAAAVAANQALSPQSLGVDEAEGVTSAIFAKDDAVPDNLNEDDEDDDDDVPRSRPRGDRMQMNQEVEEDDPNEGDNDEDDDLFGDGGEDEDEEEAPEPEADTEADQRRTLDDEELDSGDDEGRADRAGSAGAMEEEREEQELAIMEAVMTRQPIPEPTDGEVYLTKVPRFMSVDPKVWHHTSYQPPTIDHHSTDSKPSSTFSAYNTAMSTIHWRHSPSNPKEMQSNARILRWSDGSLTLQLASNPTQQHDIDGNPLAPRQRNPIKPTPTSLKPNQKDHGHDSFTYLSYPDINSGLVRFTHKITAGLTISPSGDSTDDALERLQSRLAAMAQGKNTSSSGGIELVAIDEDPDLARKKAEAAEREKMRAQKRREAAETRERERTGRVLGRSGLGSRGYGGGLNAGLLEDDEMGGSGRVRGAAKARSRRQRRNSEYSEDEDFGRQRFHTSKEDEYDEEDDFIAGSDDEEEAVASDSDPDEGMGDALRKQSKRKTPDDDDDDDEDAEAEDDDDAPVAAKPSTKRRRVIADEDEDEE